MYFTDMNLVGLGETKLTMGGPLVAKVLKEKNIFDMRLQKKKEQLH